LQQKGYSYIKQMHSIAATQQKYIK